MRGLALLLAFGAPLDGGWWKIESGPFTVYSDSDERTGRETLEKLDLARRVFAGLNRSAASMPLPVTAFTLSSESRFRALRTGEATRGFYQSAAERDYIVLQTGSPSLSRIAFHEYVHLVLNHSSATLPQWVEEGLAEFHSTLEASGGKVRLGMPIREHLRILAVTPWLNADELAHISKNSPQFNEASRTGVFYAQSWALIHMLRLDERYRSNYGQFLAALQRGETSAAAFQMAFHKSLSEVIPDLKRYLNSPSLPVVQIPLEMENSAANVRASELDRLEADMAYAQVAIAAGKPAEAEKIYRKLDRGAPDNARLAAALAALALAQKRDQDARRHLEQALKFPDASAEVHFEYAMLLRDMGGPREETRSHLERAVQLHPQYAEAHFLLGVMAANENRHADALRHLAQAAAVFPRQSYFWHAIAISAHALGRANEARHAAQRAFDSAATPQEAEIARAALRLTGTPAAPVAKEKPAVTTPDSWRNPSGDARTEGALERIDCLGQSARFHIRSGGKVLPLWVENPGAVLLKNLSSMTFEFRCGPQRAVPVVVEFQAVPNEKQKTAGVITAIEFQ